MMYKNKFKKSFCFSLRSDFKNHEQGFAIDFYFSHASKG
jgi:hypothetical protein